MTANLEQGTEAWMLARCGFFGASELGALMAKGEGKMRAGLIKQKAAERLSGVPQGWEGNASTESGHEQEPHGRRAYEAKAGVFVEQAGFCFHPTLKFAGASPDGLVDDDGGFEIKSHVRFITHLGAIESGKIPNAHLYQCQWGMACTGRKWWDYGHFCLQAPDHLRLHMFPRVMRDDALIATLEAALVVANDEVNAIVARYSR